MPLLQLLGLRLQMAMVVVVIVAVCLAVDRSLVWLARSLARSFVARSLGNRGLCSAQLSADSDCAAAIARALSLYIKAASFLVLVIS